MNIEQKLFECCLNFRTHYSLLSFVQSREEDKSREIYTKFYKESLQELEKILKEAREAGYKSENDIKKEKADKKKKKNYKFNEFDIADFKEIVNTVHSITDSIKTTAFPFLLAPNIVGVFIYNKKIDFMRSKDFTPTELFEHIIDGMHSIGILNDYYYVGKDHILFFIAPTKLTGIKETDNDNIISVKCVSCFENEEEEGKCFFKNERCSHFAGLWEGEMIKCAHSIWLDDIGGFCSDFFEFSKEEYFFNRIVEEKTLLPCLLGINSELDNYVGEKLEGKK